MISPTESRSSHPADEAHAAQVALEGGAIARARVTANALGKLLSDPNDTSQAFLVGLASNAHRFPRFLARFVASEDGARLLREQPCIDSEHIDYDALRELPATTLGGAYARFLDDQGLDPDIFQAPPGIPSMIAYISKRVRQSHDLWHVLTGYDTDVRSELALQAFTWRVTGMPSSAMIAFGGAMRFGLSPGHRGVVREVLEGARRGERAAFLPVVVWEDHFERPLAVVREELGIEA
ncbi:MAG: hypothetical protein JRH11_03120 [Deltaproteobacteria bacterium]|nr:hypothetical protein [Deltaproteobacteria bacterium]